MLQYLGLVQGLFVVGLGNILRWFRVYGGRVSGLSKVGFVIYLRLVQG